MKKGSTVRSGFLLTVLGLVYCDITTSTLYVLKYIIAESGGTQAVSEAMILGSLSLILWSLLLLATFKGVLLLLRADNQGEGGHFSLYALVRKRGRWLLFPAALGGAALLADSFLTPALTMTAAVEGSRFLFSDAFPGTGIRGVMILVLFLLSALFFSQGFGNRRSGRLVGLVMLAWLLFIGTAGAVHVAGASTVLRAFDPRIGVNFLFSAKNSLGFALLGLVFLSVTGMEILYANLDCGGRKVIAQTWPFVLLCVSLSYLGQGAWLMKQLNDPAGISGVAVDPFFQMLPYGLRFPAFALGLAAAWSASRTVMNSCFTLVSEAIRLNLLPALEIQYPSDSVRQEYIPSINFLMWLFSCAAIIAFQGGQRMASAYGLAVIISVLMTGILFFVYSPADNSVTWISRLVALLFVILETGFLLASLEMQQAGGIAVLLLIFLMTAAMISWDQAEKIEKRFVSRLLLADFLPQLEKLRSDTNYMKLADNLVYFDNGNDMATVDQAILYSILDRGPKRAQSYWIVSVNTVSDPYYQNYRAESFGTDCVFRVQLDLGYKCSRPLTRYLRDVLLDMERQRIIPDSRKSYFLSDESSPGTFLYCIFQRRASGTEHFTTPDLWALRMRGLLQRLAGLREEWYTEEDTDYEVERVPLLFNEETPEVRLQCLLKNQEDSISS